MSNTLTAALLQPPLCARFPGTRTSWLILAATVCCGKSHTPSPSSVHYVCTLLSPRCGAQSPKLSLRPLTQAQPGQHPQGSFDPGLAGPEMLMSSVMRSAPGEW